MQLAVKWECVDFAPLLGVPKCLNRVLPLTCYLGSRTMCSRSSRSRWQCWTTSSFAWTTAKSLSESCRPSYLCSLASAASPDPKPTLE